MTLSPIYSLVAPHLLQLVCAAVLVLALPATAMWGYALLRCLRERRDEGGGESDLSAATPLSAATWLLLIVLAGPFGAVAYLSVKVLPRLMDARARRPLPVNV